MKKIWLYLLFTFGVSSFAQQSDFASVDFKKADRIAKSHKSKGLIKVNKLTFQLTKNLTTDIEKFRAIYVWISHNISNNHRMYLKNNRKRKRINGIILAMLDVPGATINNDLPTTLNAMNSRFNTLVVTMSRSLSDLQKALVGEIGMSDSLDELGVEVFNGFLPSMFRRLAPNTQMKLGPWIGHFTRRMDQYTDWIENGEPAVMWLSGLGSPQSYLTSLIQSACRRLNWSLDRSTMFTKVTNIVDTKLIVFSHPPILFRVKFPFFILPFGLSR